MKLFLEKRLILLFISSLLFACATKKEQYGSNVTNSNLVNEEDTAKIAHTFYLIGDAGNTTEQHSKSILMALSKKLVTANKNSSLLFLGDNVYPKGIPSKTSDPDYLPAEQKLINQLQIAKNYKGQTIFIPGNHDWYSGIEGLKKQEDLVQDYLNDKKTFSPRKGCAIDDVKINDNILLITIDSQWFLENWDDSPTINDDCSIKTREAFFEEFEGLISKNKDKTILIAMHHPLMSNGTHGGQFSLRKQIFPLEQDIPLPVIGSFINLLRKTTGASPQDLQNKQYSTLSNRIKALIQGEDNVIVVSGHDHNLQYIDHQNIKQIISGAGSKEEAAKAVYPNDFSYGQKGYAILNVYTNGKSIVSFFNEDKLLYRQIVLNVPENEVAAYPTSFPKTKSASVYSEDRTSKSAAYRFVFGNHYRTIYNTAIEAPVLMLDTLYGGVSPKRAGGGHQSKSLRLVDQSGKEYAMRALKKSASRFLQAVAFKDQFVENDFEDTYAEDFLLDFYTSSHPYAPLAVGYLAEQIGVNHSNPKLYYIPKQNTLQEFNSNFGDELYFIEEQASETQKDLASFGNSDDIISTADLLEKLHKDENYAVDEKEYIKARLFDMLLGDWDRHQDQWRWSTYKEGDKTIYKPIPRDRDQVFSKYDGALLSILMNIPDLRHMQTFKDKIKNVKWFNREPYPMDLAILKTATEQDWIEQATYIQNNLSDEAIEKAFLQLPLEVQDETITTIKKDLKARKKELVTYAKKYSKTIEKRVLVVGTNKKDQFIIEKKPGNVLQITVNRIKKDGIEFAYSKTLSGKKTKHLWIYGLDDDDEFIVKGKAKTAAEIILLGGQNHDSYTIENGKGIRVIDFLSKKNTYNVDAQTTKKITDDYTINSYRYTLPKYNAFSGLPTLGYNPDDGLKIGIIANYTINNFKQNPYSSKHILKANYYFATSGVELFYSFKAPKVTDKWDFNLDTRFTSPNFSINFFGYGNETVNNDEVKGMNFNRVKISIFKVAPQFEKVGPFGSRLQIQTSFENIQVQNTVNRYITSNSIVDPLVFDSQKFAGVTVGYHFENYDIPSLPKMGMGFSVIGSWKTNLDDTRTNFPTFESKLNFNHKIDASGRIVLATIVKAKAILNNNYEFYQGAVLGGDLSLRGFRNERFLGKSSFYNSTDLRVSLGKIKESILPMSYGILGGYDYGRVWLDNKDNQKWHQAVGGGLWLNGLNTLTARLSYFKSREEEGRLSFALGFGF
ncbi:metallophosphoesterase [Flavobacterium faecale]|uniref:Metallophosphoesterase n=1 Tax=Flavobacterium faecale TaxID=1355330 RepID=A0A2S1LE52_9FLAO|nr:metallophosphoesterase [Flavobacterium faecale]AWG21806.1 metallophosphoesterase [Flavobacterium faecale]